MKLNTDKIMKKSLINDQIHPESIKIYTKSKDNILIED